ncbi:MAG: hypothetical protein WB797_11660 [Nocardioides sp.]
MFHRPAARTPLMVVLGLAIPLSVGATLGTTSAATAAPTFIASTDGTGPLGPQVPNVPGRGTTVPGSFAPPEGFRFLVGDELVWQQGDDGGLPITRYDVGWRTAGSSDDWTVIGSTPSQAFLVQPTDTDTGYAVRAVNALGAGPWVPMAQSALPLGVDNLVVSDRIDPAYNGAPQRLVLLSGSDEADAPNIPSSLPSGYDYRTPAASPGATNLVYARSTITGGGTDNEYDLYTSPVLDLFGDTTPNPTQLTSLPGTERDPAYSPDGTTVAFTHSTNNDFYGPLDVDASVWTVPAAGGTPVQLMADAAQPVWSANGKDLVVVSTSGLGGLVEVPVDGDSPIDLANTAGAGHPAIGPDGSLAYISEGGAGGVVVLAPGWTDSRTYSVNGAHVSGLTYGLDGRLYATVSHESNAPDAVEVVGTTDRAADPTTPSGPVAPVIRDTVAPEVQIDHVGRGTGPGTRSISFSHTDSYGPGYAGEGASTPGAALQPGTCSVDGGTWSPCTSPLVLTGLAEGTHHVRVRVTDEAGNAGTAERGFTVVTATPSISMDRPQRASAVDLTSGGKATFAWTSTPDHGIRPHFKLRWQRVRPLGHTRHRGATTADTWSRTLRQGQEICLSVRAVSQGLSSPFTKTRCLTRPYDDAALRHSGRWSRHHRSGAYGGSSSVTRSEGDELTTRSVTATRVGVLVTTGRGFGSVRAYLGRQYLGTLHLASATHRHVVLRLPTLTHALTGRVRLVTTSRRPVDIDAVAISRS